MSNSAPGLSELGQIAITVSDVAAATIFYRDVLGLKFLFSAGPTLAFFAAGSVRIMLAAPDGEGRAGANSLLYFKVDDLVATYGAVVARGAKSAEAPRLTARMPDHELWIAVVRDLDGNFIGMMSEVRPPVA